MFEALTARAARLAEARAKARARGIADDAAAVLPRGVAVEVEEGAVRFTGRRLRRRFLVEPSLRWLREWGR